MALSPSFVLEYPFASAAAISMKPLNSALWRGHHATQERREGKAGQAVAVPFQARWTGQLILYLARESEVSRELCTSIRGLPDAQTALGLLSWSSTASRVGCRSPSRTEKANVAGFTAPGYVCVCSCLLLMQYNCNNPTRQPSALAACCWARRATPETCCKSECSYKQR